MERSVWTFDLTREGLEQVHDYINRSSDPLLRIIHVLNNDSLGWEDHYICLVQCDSRTATLLALYE